MLAIGLVGAVLSANAMSRHGILLSETARLAPFGSAGAVMGGVFSFGQIGAFLSPPAFPLLLGLTGGYGMDSFTRLRCNPSAGGVTARFIQNCTLRGSVHSPACPLFRRQVGG